MVGLLSYRWRNSQIVRSARRSYCQRSPACTVPVNIPYTIIILPSAGHASGIGHEAEGPMNVKIGPKSHATEVFVIARGQIEIVTGPAECDGVMHSSL